MGACVLRWSGNMVSSCCGRWLWISRLPTSSRHDLLILYRMLYQVCQGYREKPNRFHDHRPFMIRSSVTMDDTSWQMIWIIWAFLRQLCVCKYARVSVTFTLDPASCSLKSWVQGSGILKLLSWFWWAARFRDHWGRIHTLRKFGERGNWNLKATKL